MVYSYYGSYNINNYSKMENLKALEIINNLKCVLYMFIDTKNCLELYNL